MLLSTVIHKYINKSNYYSTAEAPRSCVCRRKTRASVRCIRCTASTSMFLACSCLREAMPPRHVHRLRSSKTTGGVRKPGVHR